MFHKNNTKQDKSNTVNIIVMIFILWQQFKNSARANMINLVSDLLIIFLNFFIRGFLKNIL